MLTAAEVERIIRNGVPDADEKDLKVEAITEAGAVARFPFHQRSIRPGGTLSGPTIMALADAAMYAAVLGRLGRLEMAVTSQISIHFLHKPGPADLIARAEIMKMSSRSVVLEVKLYTEGDRQPVALATGSYALPKGPSQG